MNGVVRTRVGYAGGTSVNPTYHNLRDHTETVQVDYDPTLISYRDLLAIFWGSHDASSKSWSVQYKSAIFYHNEKQKELALNLKANLEASLGHELYTDILPFSRFYIAEDYHQKYYLSMTPQLKAEFSAKYPDAASLVNSTAAARVNGYLGSNGTLANLEKQLASLGLTPDGEKTLLQIGREQLIDRPGNTCTIPDTR